MPEKIELRGITWNHSRGYTPLVAASQRFGELFPHIDIVWKKRTLQEFADFPIEQLVNDYDLLVIDHPWVGCAAATKCVLPLDDHLPPEYLREQLDFSTGYSHQSYHYGGHQWALAIDAAAPVASYRSDLLARQGIPVPATWKEVVDMAAQGKVAAPAVPVDLLMHFYMFCLAHGNVPFMNTDEVIDRETGLKALDTMRSLWSMLDPGMLDCNPVSVAELMSTTDRFWYCPFAYGYSNYSRKGFARHVLHYTDTVVFDGSGERLRTTLGGTGLAISAHCKHREAALRFAEWVASASVQSTLYAEHGGQPGHRKAWQDEVLNGNTADYFLNTLFALKRAYVRPRYNGHLLFQDRAGLLVHKFIKGGGQPAGTLDAMNGVYRRSQGKLTITDPDTHI